jgi:hypothetical protein
MGKFPSHNQLRREIGASHGFLARDSLWPDVKRYGLYTF